MTSNKNKFEVESKLENVPAILDFIAEKMEEDIASEATIAKVQLAVDEACTNIINYAYSGHGGLITIICELVGDDFVVTIRDKGKPFDPRMVPPSDLESEWDKRKVGGLGIHLIRAVMDDVNYEFDAVKGNTLIMRKRFMRENSKS